MSRLRLVFECPGANQMILNERIHRLLILSEELHFRRAAQRLHVSQPALSGSLKSLESELGARLFRRTSRTVELTEAGNILVSEARRLIGDGERALARLRECQSDLVGPLQFGYSSGTNLAWLAALISNARAQGFSDADFRFTGHNATCLNEALEKRILDGAFLAGNVRCSDQSAFQYVRLFRENLHVVLAAGHRLARAGAASISDLHEEPVVWLRRDLDPLLHRTFAELCSTHSYWPKVIQETASFYECLQFAREGIGITFLPAFMSEDAGEGVLFRRLADPFHVDYTLLYRRNSSDVHPIDRFVTFVRDFAAEKKWTGS